MPILSLEEIGEKPICTNPDAPMVLCLVCKAGIKTCKKCPEHPQGIELDLLSGGTGWVCSQRCKNLATIV